MTAASSVCLGRAFVRALGMMAVPLAMLLAAGPAAAVPAYARQTGEPCAACHVGSFGPQLTAFGRAFKLGGYALSIHPKHEVPFSAMLVESFTHTREDQSAPAGPHDGTNDNASSQQLSLFVAGRLGEHAGTFAQLTYSDIDRYVAMDNVDIRYARTVTLAGRGAIVGVSLNNNPTLSDPWNTLAAWTFPYIGSELAPGPAAAPLIAGGLGQQVAGADVYAFVDNAVYASFGLYRTLSDAVRERIHADNSGRLAGAAPYARLAWTHDWGGRSLMLGTSALDARLQPDGRGTRSDRYRDLGVDAAYMQVFAGGDALTLNASDVFERQRLYATYAAGGASKAGHHLDALSLDASWYFHDTYGLTGGFFDTTDTTDPLLYPPEPDAGSRAGAVASRGEIVQFDWTPFGKRDSFAEPWANLRLGVQYTRYDRFDGYRRNYDGNGRNAVDNDTLYLFLWTAI